MVSIYQWTSFWNSGGGWVEAIKKGVFSLEEPAGGACSRSSGDLFRGWEANTSLKNLKNIGVFDISLSSA